MPDLTASTSSDSKHLCILLTFSLPKDSQTSINKSSSKSSKNFVKSSASDLALL